MRAAVYVRISDDKSGEELGVARQREDTEALVRHRGWTLIESYVDNDLSASDKGRKTKLRPGYEAVMAAADAHLIDRIVVWHTSRFWRSRRERADGIERLKVARVSVVPVKGPELDMSSAYGRGMAGLVGEFDTMETEVKSERQIREAQQRAAAGKPPGGRRAFGYGSDGETVDQDEAEALRWAFDQFLEHGDLSAIATGLNEAGWSTTMGGQWKHGAVRNMLRNPRYIAKRTYRKEVVADAVWPAVVDLKVWTKTQSVLAGSERRTNHVGSERKWIGSGLYRCGRCDAKMRCTYREKYGNGEARRIYRCEGCFMSRVAEPVDFLVEELLRERLALGDLSDLLLSAGASEESRANVAELRARRTSLAKLLVDGVLTEDDVRAEAGRLDGLLAAAGGSAKKPAGRALAALLRSKDPVGAYNRSDAADRHEVLDEIAVIRLLPVHIGRKKFDPESVEIHWAGS